MFLAFFAPAFWFTQLITWVWITYTQRTFGCISNVKSIEVVFFTFRARRISVDQITTTLPFPDIALTNHTHIRFKNVDVIFFCNDGSQNNRESGLYSAEPFTANAVMIFVSILLSSFSTPG